MYIPGKGSVESESRRAKGSKQGRGKQPMWFSQESVGLNVGNADFSAQQLV